MNTTFSRRSHAYPINTTRYGTNSAITRIPNPHRSTTFPHFVARKMPPTKMKNNTEAPTKIPSNTLPVSNRFVFSNSILGTSNGQSSNNRTSQNKTIHIFKSQVKERKRWSSTPNTAIHLPGILHPALLPAQIVSHDIPTGIPRKKMLS